MTKISYQVDEIKGEISWEASEFFGELAGNEYRLDKMTAAEIVKIPNLSETAKILLSAVAGAIIQHLLDKDINAGQVFESGKFIVEGEKV